MPGTYLGHLSHDDPFYHYLSQQILPQLGLSDRPGEFRVFQLARADVYLYEERHSRVRVVGKYFGGQGRPGTVEAAWRMAAEFDNLRLLQDYGFAGYPHHVVRPWGANAGINSVLVEEYCPGTSLSAVINGALYQNQGQRLFSKLTALAYFLAELHNRTATGYGVNFVEDCSYLDRLTEKLRRKQYLGEGESDELHWLRDRWREQPRMWEDRQVLVHGDATPSNFLFGKGLNVMAIDLERMQQADRVFDVGRVAGELQHFFLQARGDKYAAEPFIGHFLWEYACHFPDRERAFLSITGRLPFQMGLTLLRIARNSWVSDPYRRRLIEEAKNILRRF